MSLIDIQFAKLFKANNKNSACPRNVQQMPKVNKKDSSATSLEEVLVALVLTLKTFNMVVSYFVVNFKQLLG